MTPITNVSNLAAFAVEWWPEGQSPKQLVNERGTTRLDLSIKSLVHGRWTTISVSNPERFGLTSAPKDFKEFRRIAERFIAAATENDGS